MQQRTDWGKLLNEPGPPPAGAGLPMEQR
jgi:hypothetical protein